eukprot:6488692-Amphidinium_carterae.1
MALRIVGFSYSAGVHEISDRVCKLEPSARAFAGMILHWIDRTRASDYATAVRAAIFVLSVMSGVRKFSKRR